MSAELYLWLKAAHVASVLLFVGGTLSVSIALTALSNSGEGAIPAAAKVRRWDRSVTVPAMLATWILGLALAMTGGWIVQAWLQIKLALVLLLTGFHGIQSGRLRRLAAGADTRPGVGPAVVGLCALAIALLAVLKPS